MSDLIDREHVIDFLKLTRDSEYEKSMSAEVKHKSVIRSKHDAHVAFCDYLIEYVNQVPTHPTPSNALGALDCVSRQDAIDAVKFGITYAKAFNKYTGEVKELFKEGNKALNEAAERLKELPSAQPEQKKGKWIKDRDGIYHCSCCGTDYLMYELAVKDTHYCPNCGCRMEEGDSDDT